MLGSDEAWAQARRTTLNAHYTSAGVAAAMWEAAEALGFNITKGSGNFLGFAPPDVALTGVELDPVTAEVARHLYGARAAIHTVGFESYAAPDGSFDVVIGNVPFAKVTPHDPRHNRGGHATGVSGISEPNEWVGLATVGLRLEVPSRAIRGDGWRGVLDG